MPSSVARDLQPISDARDQLRGELLDMLIGDAAFAVKKHGLRVAESVTGGDRRLSRFGGGKVKGRSRMGIGYDVEGGTAVVKYRPAGMWVLMTLGARSHMIGIGRRSRSGRYTRRRKVPTFYLPRAVAPSGSRGRGTRHRVGPIDHPGMVGRGAMFVAVRPVPETVDRVVSERLDEILNG